jgi:hypothetical protein
MYSRSVLSELSLMPLSLSKVAEEFNLQHWQEGGFEDATT